MSAVARVLAVGQEGGSGRRLLKLLTELQSEAPGAPRGAYLQAMRLESRRSGYENVLKIYELMIDSGLAPCRAAYHYRMNAAGELHDLGAVKALLQEMTQYRVRAGITAMNILLKTMLKCGDPALESFRVDLLHNRLKQSPNRFTWPLLIAACPSLQSADDTLRLLRVQKFVIERETVVAALLEVCAKDARWGVTRAEKEVAALLEARGPALGMLLYTKWAAVYFAAAQYEKVHAVWLKVLGAHVPRTPRFVLMQMDALVKRAEALAGGRREPLPDMERTACPPGLLAVKECPDSWQLVKEQCMHLLSRTRRELQAWSRKALRYNDKIFLAALRVYALAKDTHGAARVFKFARAANVASRALHFQLINIATEQRAADEEQRLPRRSDPADALFFIQPTIDSAAAAAPPPQSSP